MYKLSAEDIVNQTFERCFRGYDPDQVEEFLVAVAREWEHLRNELEKAREEADEKSRKLEEYEQRQDSLQEALEMAKRVSDEIKEKAEREAELTVADAEVEADRIVSRAEDRVGELREEIAALKKQRRRYAAELKSVIRSHLEFVERIEEDDSESVIRRAPTPPEPEPEAEMAGESSDDGEAEAETSAEAIAVDDEDIEDERRLREPQSGVDAGDEESDASASQSHPPINESLH